MSVASIDHRILKQGKGKRCSDIVSVGHFWIVINFQRQSVSAMGNQPNGGIPDDDQSVAISFMQISRVGVDAFWK
jgi:hypothetical protein